MSKKPTEHKPELLQRLAKYDSPTVCNAIELLRIRPNTAGYMSGSIRAVFPKFPPIVGYASTATFRSSYPAVGQNVYQRVPDHIERMHDLPEPRIVVLQDLDATPVAASTGEVMARLYKRFGCVGLVTNGAVRDLLQVEAIGFSLFSAEVIVSHGYPHLEEFHVPVHVGGVTVHPGDLIHADGNGVTSIPHEYAELVAEGCEEFCAGEKELMDFVDDRNTTLEQYRKAWEKTSKRFEALSQTLRKKGGIA